MHSRYSFRLAACFVLALGLAGSARAQDKSADLAIIAHKDAKLDDVSSADLQRYFRAEKTKTPSGVKIVLAMHETGRPERAAALSGIYKMSETEYANYFVEATFTGAVSAAPKAFASPDAVKKFVAQTPGALSYIRGSDADDTVRVLKIDGKSPGEAGYKLNLK